MSVDAEDTEAGPDEQEWNELREAHKQLVEYHWNRILKTTYKAESPVTWYRKVKVDDWMTVTLGEWGGYLIQIMPMLFNDRLVMTPKSSLGTYDYGWCYDKGGAAGLAALAWNPQAHGEPVGFKKRIHIGARRVAGQHAAGIHGD